MYYNVVSWKLTLPLFRYRVIISCYKLCRRIGLSMHALRIREFTDDSYC